MIEVENKTTVPSSSSKTCGPVPPTRRLVRVLFACTGWPSGIIEVASWAKSQRLADPIVFQMQPGHLFRLDPEDGYLLTSGPADPKLIDSFARHRWPLSDDAMIVPIDNHIVEIHDRQREQIYRIVDEQGHREVYLPKNYENEHVLNQLHHFTEACGRADHFFMPDGTPNRTAQHAILAVGGDFLLKLLDFAPHVVGFRLENYNLKNIQQAIRAVRLFHNAEVVLGGPTATSHPLEVLDDLGADYIFVGDAEATFCQFLQFAQQNHYSKRYQPEIPGLTYRYGGRLYHNTLPQDGYERTLLDAPQTIVKSTCTTPVKIDKATIEIDSIKSDRTKVDNAKLLASERPPTSKNARLALEQAIRPTIDNSLIRANRLNWSLLNHFKQEFDSLFFTGGRGCPGHCTFCAKLHGQRVRTKTAQQLFEEIEAADAKVAEGTLQVVRWKLFEHVDDPEWKEKQVAWAAIYDDDFFLHRNRALEFFELWDQSPLKHRYRLGVQTNPQTLLDSNGRFDKNLRKWIERLKPMLQLGAESFNEELLIRWQKRHRTEQLHTVLETMDSTGQDYAIFVLLTDFDTTPEELIETLRQLVLSALSHRRMRIACSPFTIPLYDSEVRRQLEFRRLITPDRIQHFSDYERPRPDWLDPLVAELADLADSELRFALNLQWRDSALVESFQQVLDRIVLHQTKANKSGTSGKHRQAPLTLLRRQAEYAMQEIKEAQFQDLGLFRPVEE